MPRMPAPGNSTISPAMHVLQAVDAGDAVADAQHLAGLGNVGLGIERGDLLLQDLRDLGRADLHLGGSLHGVLQALQTGFEAGVVEAGADLDDQPAEQVGIDLLTGC